MTSGAESGKVLPKISVITVCYNSVATIADTLSSVASQTGINVEHVVIDGKSTDGTLAIIDKYRNRIAHFLSEPDSGIYDAMNKGIRAATGDFVGFLNADDVFQDDGVLERIARALADGHWDCAHGDLVYVAQDNLTKVRRYWKSSPYVPGMFQAGWHPAHPTLYVRRCLLEELGGFDTGFRYHSDFDLMVRLFVQRKVSSTYLPELLVRMRIGGHSNRSIRNIYRGNRESYVIASKFGVASSPWWMVRKLWFRVTQYFKRPVSPSGALPTSR